MRVTVFRAIVAPAVASMIALAGCGGGTNSRPCALSTDCLQGGISGFCLPSPSSTSKWCAFPDLSCPGTEEKWGVLAGDGLAETCVAPQDAGVIDGGVDGGPIDAHVTDAFIADAVVPPDATPAGPIAVSGQFATLVLGQSNYAGLMGNAGGISAGTLYTPVGIAALGSRLWVADNGNARVLQWDSLPIVNKQMSNVTIGQGSPTTVMPGASQSTLGNLLGGSRVSVAGTKVVVSDTLFHRVMIYDPIPTAHGPAATVVLGQSTFTATTNGKTAGKLDYPMGVWSDGASILVVADSNNNRVLIWHSLPTTNGQAADTVLGQSAFGLGAGDPVSMPPTASSMSSPQDVFFDGTRLYVVDKGNHRVMVWNSLPAVGQNNKPADFFIGQGGPTDGSPNAGGAGPNAVGFDTPRAITVGLGAVFVADMLNHRVMIYAPIPTTSGAMAIAALGQDDLLTGVDPGTTASQNRMKSPYGLAIAGNELYVSDFTWCRVLRFDLNHP